MGGHSGSGLQAGFAKLKGIDFEFYLRSYSIIIGRNSKNSTVDLDLTGLGGRMNISRQHARMFYNFDSQRFELEVLGKNGVHVGGQLCKYGSSPVPLKSQDLIQIGDKNFYFLLPARRPLQRSGPGADGVKPHGLGKRKFKETSGPHAKKLAVDDFTGGSLKATGARSTEFDDARPIIAGRPSTREEEMVHGEILMAAMEMLEQQEPSENAISLARLNAHLYNHHRALYIQARDLGLLPSEKNTGKGSAERSPLACLLQSHPDHFVVSQKHNKRKGVVEEFVALRPRRDYL